MTHHTMNVARGVLIGLAVGGAAGMTTALAVKPKKKKMKRTAAHALDTVGNLMQSLADYTR